MCMGSVIGQLPNRLKGSTELLDKLSGTRGMYVVSDLLSHV